MATKKERKFLTDDEAIAMLDVQDGCVHTFVDPGGVLLGADWDEGQAIKEIKQADTCELAGETATSMKHGLAVMTGSRCVFFATKLQG